MERLNLYKALADTSNSSLVYLQSKIFLLVLRVFKITLSGAGFSLNNVSVICGVSKIAVLFITVTRVLVSTRKNVFVAKVILVFSNHLTKP